MNDRAAAKDGKPPVFAAPFLMAPMAGVTDPPFRDRLRRNGCRALWTEMVSAAAIVRNHKGTLALIAPPDQEDSMALQLFGAKPEELSEAAALVFSRGWSRLDLNMGCPVKKVVRSGSGSALMRDPAHAGKCIEAIRSVFGGILTVKIRLGWSEEEKNHLEIGRVAERCRVDGLIIHGRTKAQGYSGEADWGEIGKLRATVNVPVAGNGDVTDGGEAARLVREGVVDAVMIGRAALAAPWIFRQAHEALENLPPSSPPTPPELASDLRTHFDALISAKGERVAVAEMKKFVAWADRGQPGAAERRNRVMKALSPPGILAAIEEIGSLPAHEFSS